MRYLKTLTLLLSLSCSGAFAGPIADAVPTDPNLAAISTSFSGTDIGDGIDISTFGASISTATGAATGLAGVGTLDLSFAFDPADPTSLPTGSLPSPFVSIDPSYLVLSTLLAIDGSAGTINLLFENDDPGSSGFTDFNDQVLVSIELIGVAGDPFAYIADEVADGFGFADFDANIVVDNVAKAPSPGTPLLVTLGLLIVPLARRSWR
jgi:hypothetical protein